MCPDFASFVLTPTNLLSPCGLLEGGERWLQGSVS